MYKRQVDYFTIDRNGGVTFDDRADSETIENLIDTLDNQGFKGEPQAVEASEPAERTSAGVEDVYKTQARCRLEGYWMKYSPHNYQTYATRCV